jgi:hypothetical protein
VLNFYLFFNRSYVNFPIYTHLIQFFRSHLEQPIKADLQATGSGRGIRAHLYMEVHVNLVPPILLLIARLTTLLLG